MPIDNGSQKALGADVASTLYGVNGQGLKVGIISDSFDKLNGYASDVAANNLPAHVTVLNDANGDDEGRAMMQLCYRIAPNATYYFASGKDSGGSQTVNTIAAAVTALKNAGCNVIIDDLFASGEGIYQVGTALDQFRARLDLPEHGQRVARRPP